MIKLLHLSDADNKINVPNVLMGIAVEYLPFLNFVTLVSGDPLWRTETKIHTQI